MKIVAVTSCATGIAHSYMAAEALKKAARETGDEIKVETQGAMGIENRLSQEEIDNAGIIIWANDVGVREPERFDENKIVKFGPYETIKNAKEIIEKAKEIIEKAKKSK